MIDGAGNVPRYGNQTAVGTQDFEQIYRWRVPRGFAPAWTHRLCKFKRVTVAHGDFLAASHQ